MARVFMAVIDGTGDFSDASYRTVMRHSFCQQLARGLRDRAYYQRGPSLDGWSVRTKAIRAAKWIMERRKKDRWSKVMLAGYSRGASAAIYAAEVLLDSDVRVDALFLFDAVARHPWLGGEVIPRNVRFSRHACRKLDPSFVNKYEGTLNHGLGNPARTWFGQTGVRFQGRGNHLKHRFLGSHGALGGVGFSFVKEDAECQRQVALWMNQALASQGVSMVLRP